MYIIIALGISFHTYFPLITIMFHIMLYLTNTMQVIKTF